MGSGHKTLDKEVILTDSASSKYSHSMICKTSRGTLGTPINGNQRPFLTHMKPVA